MLTLQSSWIRRGALCMCLGLGLGLGANPGTASAADPPKAAAPAKGAPAKGKGKGKKGVIGAKSSALSNALNEKGAQIQQCAVEHGLEKGAKKAEILVRVTINKSGAVVDTHINVKLDSGDTSKVEECVEKFVRSAKFPAVPTPLATSERSWTVAVQ
jgi:hypothetical protein